MPDETMPVSGESALTFEQLAALVADVDEAQVMTFVGGFSPQALVEWGDDVATARITSDGRRLLSASWTFFNMATPSQLRAVRALSQPLIKAAIWAMVHGAQLHQQLKDAKASHSGVSVR